MAANTDRLENLEKQRRLIDHEIGLEKRRGLGARLKVHFQRLGGLDELAVLDEIDRAFRSVVVVAGDGVKNADDLALVLDGMARDEPGPPAASQS